MYHGESRGIGIYYYLCRCKFHYNNDVHEDRFVSIAMDNAETVGPFTIQKGMSMV